MARAYCTELTRRQLEDMGICSIYRENGEWYVRRYWFMYKCKTRTIRTIKVGTLSRKHKYAPTTEYPGLVMSYKGRSYSLTLSRMVYAWFHGKVKSGMQIDHINNNKFDCRLINLKQSTPEENSRKRFADNPEKEYFNQYTYINEN